MIIRLIRKISTQISPDDFKVIHETVDIEFKHYIENYKYKEAHVKNEDIEKLLHNDVVAVEIIQS